MLLKLYLSIKINNKSDILYKVWVSLILHNGNTKTFSDSYNTYSVYISNIAFHIEVYSYSYAWLPSDNHAYDQ